MHVYAYTHTHTHMQTRVDVGLQKIFFDYGKYLLMASSMPGSQPANLVGIWSEGLSTPWAGDYHININMQVWFYVCVCIHVHMCMHRY
jgi:alpha-L-fucosidase 2